MHQALQQSGLNLAIYLAGADPYAGDRLGRLGLSKEGLLDRDRMIMQHCYHLGLPLAVVMAGGYAKQVEDTIDIHYQTISTLTHLYT